MREEEESLRREKGMLRLTLPSQNPRNFLESLKKKLHTTLFESIFKSR